MNYNISRFNKGLSDLKIQLDENQMKQFIRYYELLIEKNKVMNLTGITEFEEVVDKHFLDSLSLIKIVNLEGSLKLLDLGTGAGFPGIPLKIVFPDLEILLLDSLNKRVLFLNEVIEDLHLKNISAIHGRAEELARKKEYRESFDICVSRAVANLSSLSEYCIPFVKKNGSFISYKSGEIEEELTKAKKAIYILGGKVKEVNKFQLTGTEIQRSLVQIEKVKHSPKAYPRKAGTPEKEPLQ